MEESTSENRFSLKGHAIRLLERVRDKELSKLREDFESNDGSVKTVETRYGKGVFNVWEQNIFAHPENPALATMVQRMKKGSMPICAFLSPDGSFMWSPDVASHLELSGDKDRLDSEKSKIRAEIGTAQTDHMEIDITSPSFEMEELAVHLASYFKANIPNEDKQLLIRVLEYDPLTDKGVKSVYSGPLEMFQAPSIDQSVAHDPQVETTDQALDGEI